MCQSTHHVMNDVVCDEQESPHLRRSIDSLRFETVYIQQQDKNYNSLDQQSSSLTNFPTETSTSHSDILVGSSKHARLRLLTTEIRLLELFWSLSA